MVTKDGVDSVADDHDTRVLKLPQLNNFPVCVRPKNLVWVVLHKLYMLYTAVYDR
jgi:hypothetical protein